MAKASVEHKVVRAAQTARAPRSKAATASRAKAAVAPDDSMNAEGMRKIHVLAFTVDGKDMVQKYTRFSKAVADMRALVGDGHAVTFKQEQGRVEPTIVA